MAFEKEVQNFTAEGTELPESKLTTGFLAGEKPPANWFNNLFYRFSQAIREIQEKAVEKEYVDEQINATTGNVTEELEAKAETVTYIATIPSAGWTTEAPYYVDVTVTGLLETDSPMITPVYSGELGVDQAIQEAWNKIDRGVANADSLRVYAFEEVPTHEIPVQIQVVR